MIEFGSNLNLTAINLHGGTQSRALIDEKTVEEYAEILRGEYALPPIVVFYDGDSYWLADGFHRFHAFKRVGLVKAPVDIRQGTQRDAILFSVGANATHGLRRTNEDKRRAVQTLLQDEEWSTWSDRKIATAAGVSNQFVSNVRLSVNGGQIDPVRTVERSGTVYQQNTAAIGKPQSQPTIQDFSPLDVAARKQPIDEVLTFLSGSKLDNPEYFARIAYLPPNEQMQAARRDLAIEKAKDGKEAQEQARAALPQHIKDAEAAKHAAITGTDVDSEIDALRAKASEYEEYQKAVEADIAELTAENRTYADMRVQFEQGGFDAVLKGKDTEIWALKSRVERESADKVSWMRKCEFWRRQAVSLGWKGKGDATDNLPPDEDFIATISEANS